MCADHFYDKQVNDIYEHLEEEEARAAKRAEERAYHRDWIGEGVREALREARQEALLAVPTEESDEAMWQREDALISGMDFSRWQSDSYTLRKEEYLLYVDAINNSTLARERGLIVWFTPDEYLAQAMDAPDINWEAFTMTLRNKDQTKFAELVDSRPGGVARIVFPHLDVDKAHWTLHEHDLRGGRHVVTSWDSLSSTTSFEMDDQMTIARGILRSGRTRGLDVGELPADETLRTGTTEFITKGTGLQTDNASCGFWSVMFAWAILLDIDIARPAFQNLTVEEIKEILEDLWRHWIEDAGGLATALVADLFDIFDPSVQWESVPPVFSAPDSTMPERREGPRDDQLNPLPLLGREGDREESGGELRSPSILERPELRTRLKEVLEGRDPTTWNVAGEDFEQVTVEHLVGGRAVSNYLLDAVIRLVLEDLRAGWWDVAFGAPPGADAPDAHRVYVNTWLDSFYLAKADGVNADGGIAPPKKSNARWYSKMDIFSLDMLVIPYFWKEAKHWVCAVVDMRDQTIAVYDSLKDARRRKALYRRVYKMLQYEWAAVREGELGKHGWMNDAGPYVRLNFTLAKSYGTDYGDTLHCAIYALTFALERICGRHPDNGVFTFSGANANIRRQAMALRLVAALPEMPGPDVSPTAAGSGGGESLGHHPADERIEGDEVVAHDPADERIQGDEVSTTRVNDGPREHGDASVRLGREGVRESETSSGATGADMGLTSAGVDNVMDRQVNPSAATAGAASASSLGATADSDLASHKQGMDKTEGYTGNIGSSGTDEHRCSVSPRGAGAHPATATANSCNRETEQMQGEESGKMASTAGSVDGRADGVHAPRTHWPPSADGDLNPPKEGEGDTEPTDAGVQPEASGPHLSGSGRSPTEPSGGLEGLKTRAQAESFVSGSDIDEERQAVGVRAREAKADEALQDERTTGMERRGGNQGARARSLSPSDTPPASSVTAAVVRAKGPRKSAPLEALERAMEQMQRLEPVTRELCSRAKESEAKGPQVDACRLPAVGEWEMLVWKKAVVARCPYRAFPAEVRAVEHDSGWVTLQVDSTLLVLDEPEASYDGQRLGQVLGKARRVKWSQYHKEIRSVGRDEVAPMIWPAALERRVNVRAYAAARTNERQMIRDHLLDMLPAMAQILTEGDNASGLFAELITEGLLSQNEGGSGGGPRTGSATVGMWEFFMRRTSHPAKVDDEYEPILDALDEAVVVEMADRLWRQLDSLAGPDDLHVKTATAGRVYLAYGALSMHTALPLEQVGPALAAGQIRRPETRWERAWKAYAKLGAEGVCVSTPTAQGSRATCCRSASDPRTPHEEQHMDRKMAGKDDGEGDCANRAVAKTPGDHDHNDGGGEEEGKMTLERNVAAGRRLMEEAHLRNVWIEDAMRMEEREGHGRAVVLRWLSNEEMMVVNEQQETNGVQDTVDTEGAEDADTVDTEGAEDAWTEDDATHGESDDSGYDTEDSMPSLRTGVGSGQTGREEEDER
ncbi:hypothetical protein C8Q76DRAFT_783456 [Earliella scabrosa]|nr:hypothetical protein C8Q76DRAFT_783456 [Earliella scabrosa]